MMMSHKKSFVFWILAVLFALVWLVIAGAPFFYLITISMKSQGEFLTGSLFKLPERFSFQNYVTIMRGAFFGYFFNSVFVLVVSLFLLLIISSFAAYPLSRMEFKLNKPIFSLIVAAMSIPIHITLIPVFSLSVRTNLYDSLYALIGPNVAFNLPMSTFILTGFMKGISRELEEAAEIDGCGKFRTFFKIVFPLSRSGLATLGIYNGVVIWNEFSFAMVLTQSPSNFTLPLSVWTYQGQYTMDVPLIMSLLVLASLPIILLYIFGQDKLIKGMMAGAVKG
ncbi:MAG: carbohydrate ABC transporter permease [Treponema sp.]|jgi:raffinose/stachyose/melibiose transport system permease protein|nr:carbohydrate ABC transporter permease [Treponema sp.]